MRRQESSADKSVGVIAISNQNFKDLLKRAIVLPALLLGILTILLLWQFARLSSASQWVLHTEEIVDQTRQLQTAMLDMETGMREYLIFGNPEFLDIYKSAKPKLIPGLLHLAELASTKPTQIARLESLRIGISNWMKFADEKIFSRSAIGNSHSLELFKGHAGKVLTDDIRRQIQEFIAEENLIQKTRTRDFQLAERGLISSIVIATVLLAFILIYFGRRQLRSLSASYEMLLQAEAEKGLLLQNARAAAQKSSDEVVEILDGMKDGFLETDANWNIIRVNRGQERFFNLQRNKTIGRNIWDVFPAAAVPSEPFWQENHKAMNERQIIEFEDYYPLADAWAEHTVYPRLGGGISIFFHDITENKRYREALAEKICALENERAIREIFVSTLSHDLRNPLGVVQMSSQIILDEAAMMPTEHRKLVKMIYNASERANRMIENLLDANRIKAGKNLPLKIESQDLFIIASEIIRDIELVYKNKIILTSSDSAINGYWSADAIRRMLENLITNAIKYGTANSDITVKLRTPPEHVESAVHNHGNPLTKEERLKIFEPFQRSQSAQTSGQQGWGLGLTLVKGLAEAHGGSIRVESSADTGTTFIVCLPRDLRRSLALLPKQELGIAVI